MDYLRTVEKSLCNDEKLPEEALNMQSPNLLNCRAIHLILKISFTSLSVFNSPKPVLCRLSARRLSHRVEVDLIENGEKKAYFLLDFVSITEAYRGV